MPFEDRETEEGAAIWLGVIGVIYTITTFIAANRDLNVGFWTAIAGVTIMLIAGAFARQVVAKEAARRAPKW